MSQWPMVKLGDVCRPVSNRGDKDDLEVYSVTKHNGFVLSSEYFKKQVFSKNTKNYKICERDDFAYATIHLDEGSIGFSPERCLISPMYTVFRPDYTKVDKTYLLYLLKSERSIAQYSILGSGSVERRKSIKFNDLAKLQFPLPPLDEQRRIAEILKRSSQQISNARQKLDHLLMISLNTMDAHFTAEAVAGDRGWSQIGDFVISTQYGTSKKANEPQGIPVLRMGNITYEGELDLKDLKYVELDELERKKFNLKNCDILFNRTNSPELVGKTTVYDSQSEMTFAGYLVRVRTSEDARPEYISGFLNSSYGKAYLRNQAKSIVGMANINAKEFLKIPIPSANESEQGVFSSLYIHCRSQINLVRKKITLLEELHQSLATRAFAGQL